jgi:hypothetical protein
MLGAASRARMSVAPKRNPMNPSHKNVKFDADRKQRFLAFFEQHGLFYQAAAAAGVSGQCVRDHLKADADFKAAFDEAEGAFKDRVEQEVQRRAVEGYDEYVTCKDGLVKDEQGNPVMQRRYSDKLLELFIKRLRPEAFRENRAAQVAVNVNTGVLLIPAGQTAEQWQAQQTSLMQGNAPSQQAPALPRPPLEPGK